LRRRVLLRLLWVLRLKREPFREAGLARLASSLFDCIRVEPIPTMLKSSSALPPRGR